MILYLLDTNVLSDFIKGIHAGLMERMAHAIRRREVSMSAITRAEFRYGQHLTAMEDRRRKRIDLLLDDVPALPRTFAACAPLWRDQGLPSQAGTPIGAMDTQIVAHAVSEGLHLVTHNTRHFERIPELTLEDWTL